MSDYPQEKSGGNGLAVVALLIGAVALATAGASMIMLTRQLSNANGAIEKAAESRIKGERQLADMHTKLITMEERLATADRNRQSLREQVLDLEEKLHSTGSTKKSKGKQKIFDAIQQNGGEDQIGDAIGEALMKSMAGLLAAGQAGNAAAGDAKPAPKEEDLVDEKGRPTMTPVDQRKPVAAGVPDLD
ncbi:MAG: hypothetical protein ACI8W8_001035 [Rhodothermales bacterium]|jgi:hypothetical protein